MAREDGALPMVSYWGIWNDGPEKEIPPGMIGAQAVGCANPACKTGCPAVAVALTTGGEIVQLRMEPDAAREFAAIVLAAANAAAPAMKGSAN